MMTLGVSCRTSSPIMTKIRNEPRPNRKARFMVTSPIRPLERRPVRITSPQDAPNTYTGKGGV